MSNRGGWSSVAIGGVLLVGLFSCSKGAPVDPRFPPRPVGCIIKTFQGPAPSSIRYTPIGRVDVICSKYLSESDCLRGLEDEACKLGGDLLFDVPETPSQPEPDKVKYTGRVAHTREAVLAPPAP